MQNLLYLHEFFEFYIKQNSSTLYAQRNAGPNTDKGQNILRRLPCHLLLSQNEPGDLNPKNVFEIVDFWL